MNKEEVKKILDKAYPNRLSNWCPAPPTLQEPDRPLNCPCECNQCIARQICQLFKSKPKRTGVFVPEVEPPEWFKGESKPDESVSVRDGETFHANITQTVPAEEGEARVTKVSFSKPDEDRLLAPKEIAAIKKQIDLIGYHCSNCKQMYYIDIPKGKTVEAALAQEPCRYCGCYTLY